MENIVSALGVLVTLVSAIAWYRRWKSVVPAGLTLPPGPSPLPILGSALDVSRSAPWLTYTAWANKYGPLVYVRLLGRDVIIINSEELLQELVEKRSSIYNDRPRYVTNEFYGVGFNSGFLPYGDAWRFHRRLLHQTFRPAALPGKMHPIMLRKRRQLVKAIVDSPDACLDLLHTHATSVIMAAVYGYETQPRNDRLVHVVDRMLKFTMHAMTPEREALASTFPIIQYIPTWMPGSQYRRDGLQCREYCKEMLEVPFEYTMDAIASGHASSSMVTDLLSQYAGRGDITVTREAVKRSASTVFGAASGTTDTALLCFVLAMVLYPDVQRRAREEIDRVVGPGRLPNFEDRSSLTYVEAVLRELWRWRPTNPLGVPHATNQEDVYKRWYVPQGSMVLVNIWAMSRCSDKYPDPDEFRPERFLCSSPTSQSESDSPEIKPDIEIEIENIPINGPPTPPKVTPSRPEQQTQQMQTLTDDKVQFAFGGGRRMCVGRHFADATVWSTIVTLLACFELFKGHEPENGWREGWGIEDVEWINGVAVLPCPFPVKVTIRDRAKMVAADEA